MTLDLVISGGTVVDGGVVTRADVGIRDGKVVALGLDLPQARSVVDAQGRLVLPGGVDVHCHLAQVSAKATRTADDFLTGTRSAAHGGTTTVMAFAAQQRGERIIDALERGLRAASRAVIDVGLHLIVTDLDDPDAEKGLAAAAEAGVTTVKVFLTYERVRVAEAELVSLLSLAKGLGMQVMVHAEHHGMVTWRTRRLLDAGQHGLSWHRSAHSREAEAAGIGEIAAIARYVDVPLYIVHVTCREALAAIRDARQRGVTIIAETCPHYLTLDETQLDSAPSVAARYMCSPPLRDHRDREALWEALRAGEVQVVSSDHAPYRLSEKLPRSDETTFVECTNGIPGVELRMPLLFSEGVNAGRLAVTDLVMVACEAPARAMGVFPQKGSLRVGADADVVVWDPTIRRTVTQATLHDNMDHTPYEGMDVQGWPTTVVSRGEIVVEQERESLAEGRGKFLARSPAAPAERVSASHPKGGPA